MFVIKIFLSATLLTCIGVGSADAASKLTPPTLKSHPQVTTGLKKVTPSKQLTPRSSRATGVCSTMQGLAYGAALVGLQSTLIVLPSFASGVGVPVGAIATGVGVVATGVGFVTMVAHDMACK